MVVEEEEEGRECKSQKRVAKEDTRSALVIGVRVREIEIERFASLSFCPRSRAVCAS